MTVHVWGLPEAESIDDDAALCADAGDDHFVVYHVDPRWLACGEWCCAGCGFSTAWTDSARLGEVT